MALHQQNPRCCFASRAHDRSAGCCRVVGCSLGVCWIRLDSDASGVRDYSETGAANNIRSCVSVALTIVGAKHVFFGVIKSGAAALGYSGHVSSGASHWFYVRSKLGFKSRT